MSESISVTITQKDNYQFVVDFGAGMAQMMADEPAPLGKGDGPAPTHMLLAAVANCLSASLLFAIKKFKQDPGGITTTARCIVDRNESNRLRVLGIDVAIKLGRGASEIEHIDRVLAQFEEFCTVSQSVRAGIPINIEVADGSGQRLK